MKYGQLCKKDIEKNNKLIIFPKKNECLQAASYDLTPTMIAMSSKMGMLECIYRSKNNQIYDNYYIIVKPKDTVLIVSREYLSLPNNIAGYVTSRVSNVVKGFGHISTTIDPNWNGAILIALSNPSNIPLKINVSSNNANPLATVTFHYLHTKYIINENSDKISMRVDLLKNEISYKVRHGPKAYLRRLIHFKRRKLTDYFFEYLESNNDLFSETGWYNFLNEFSNLKISDKRISKHFKDYIVNENGFNKAKQFIDKYRSEIKFALSLFCIIILFILYKLRIFNLEEAIFWKNLIK